MRSRSSKWKTFRGLEKKELRLLDPVASATCKWEHDQAMFSDHSMTPHTVWVLPQYWPSMPGIPRLTSTIVLFFSCQETATGTVRKWCAAQHYTCGVEADLDGEGAEKRLDGAPCSAVRNVVEMKNPVLISLGHHGLPILAQSFNHLGWIEEAEDNAEQDDSHSHRRFGRLLESLSPRGMFSRLRDRITGGRRALADVSDDEIPPKRRQLKLVTFPDPGVSSVSPNCRAKHASQAPIDGSSFDSTHDSDSREDRSIGETEPDDSDECDCTTLKPVTLDVPPEILDKTYHMFLDSAAGSVTLATEDNELFEYRYGRTRPMINA